MRPLERLPNGKQYKTYQSYKTDLLLRYGAYCAYCEKHDYDLDVEHVEPKSKSGKITDWDNLVLACPTCNRDFKKAFNPSRVGYLFPDTDETFAAFHYLYGGTIHPQGADADATRKLCGLDRAAANSNRADVFALCCRYKPYYLSGRLEADDILSLAKTSGHWSVWMTVFHDIPTMVAHLRDPSHFPGTRPTFMHPATAPVFTCS